MFDPILDYDESDNEFEPYYRIVQTKVVDTYHWYKKHKSPARLCFRITGATVIIFSVTIPAILAYEFPKKDILVAIMALSIAVFTGFNTFFKWGEKWQGYSRSELAISHLIGLWQLKLQEAKRHENMSNRLSEAGEATKQLLEDVGKIVSRETENYFSNVQWPKKQG